MPRTLALIALLALSQPLLAADAQPPRPSETNILYTITVVETARGGDSAPRAARMLMLDGARGELHTGWRIPIPVTALSAAAGEATPVTTIQYQDIGLSISLEGRLGEGGQVHSRGRVEVSGIGDEGATGSQAPRVSTFSQRFEVALVDGVPAVLAEVPRPGSGSMTLRLSAEILE